MEQVKTNTGLIAAACAIVFAIGLVVGILMGNGNRQYQADKTEEEILNRELPEWVVLQMAIMKTESEFDPSRIGATNDIGINQITPIFVEEANRILDKEVYSHLDAFNIRKSIEMFNVVQEYHNYEHSISKAIAVQNPGGASIGYGKRVYDNIRFIKRMEEARRELLVFEKEK